MAQERSLGWNVSVMSGMIISGTINTLAKSIQNNTPSRGWDGVTKDFHHPWFQTLLMFIGEALCFIPFMALRLHYQKKRASSYSSIGGATEDKEALQYTQNSIFTLLFLPATLFDLAGTTLGGIGLIWVPASVWQMMRGSIIIFSGFLSVLFLKRKLKSYQWAGIAITAVGLMLVGVAGLMASEAESDDSNNLLFIIGIVLIIIGQFCSSCQMVYEEKFLKGKNYAALQAVGTEGIFGVILMVFIVLPLCWFIPGKQNGHYDDSTDAIIQIMNSNILIVTSVIYIASIAFYNFFGLTVAKVLTTVHRTLLDAVRIIFVWGADLFIYYAISIQRYGEQWTHWSYLELFGFVVLLLGNFTYYGVIKWPFFDYEQKEEKALVVNEENQ